MLEIVGFIVVGIAAGILAGLLGLGGGLIIIPALVYGFGFDQKMAQGTTLMVMLPPIGLLAALEYSKAGHVNVKAALIIAAGFLIFGHFGAKLAMKIDTNILQKVFAVFLMLVAIRMWFTK